MKTGKIVAIAAGAALALLSTGCASGATTTVPQSTSSQAPSGNSSRPAINIMNFGFQGSASVAPGATVTVTNMDAATHTVTSDNDSSFNVTVNGNGGTATFIVPTQPGSYPYHCNFHADMHGTLVVK